MVISPDIPHVWPLQTALRNSQLGLVYVSVFILQEWYSIWHFDFWWTTSLYCTVKYTVFPFRIILALFTEYLQESFEFYCNVICFFKSSITINEICNFVFSFHSVPKGFPDGNNGADKKHMVWRLC